MTFTTKIRGAGGPMLAEYLCENHGRIEKLVDRDEKGDPPELVLCGEPIELYGNAAQAMGAEPGETVECDQWCEFAVSATSVAKDSIPCTAVVRGGDMKDRPPGMLDTRPLAEGMPMSEWKKIQKKHTEDRRHKELIAKGLKTKKIQVG